MGRVVNRRAKAKAEDAAFMLAGKAKGVYRLILPTNSLGILAKLAPKLPVTEIQGLGKFSKMTTTSDFEFGKYSFGSSGQVLIDWVYDSQSGPMSVADIYEKCVKIGFPDISLARLAYIKQLPKPDATIERAETIPSFATLVFKAESVHPQTYANVLSGNLPMSQMYETLKKFKSKLDIPKEMLVGWKPNYLKLLCFFPRTANPLMGDFWAMSELQEAGMFVTVETASSTRAADMKVAHK